MNFRTHLLMLCSAMLVAGIPASADPWKDESGHGHYENRKHNGKQKHRGKGHAGRRYAQQGPPPWAPAHGYRRKHGDHHEHGRHGGGRSAPVLEVEFEQASHRIGISSGTCNRETVGAVAGGVFGAIIGNKSADPEHKTEATALGALIGVVVGKEIGRRMDKADVHCNNQALERARDGQTVTWNNPETGHRYAVTPYETFERDGGYCRKYATALKTPSGTERHIKTSCRGEDGVWKIKS